MRDTTMTSMMIPVRVDCEWRFRELAIIYRSEQSSVGRGGESPGCSGEAETYGALPRDRPFALSRGRPAKVGRRRHRGGRNALTPYYRRDTRRRAWSFQLIVVLQ